VHVLNIIIVGNGKVGYTVAQYLSNDGHDVTVLDNNKDALVRASETLDVMCLKGNGANVIALMEAGVENCDVIIALTGNDELNMVCCLAAKQLGAKYSIARIRDPEYTDSLTLLQKKLDIDQVINPERATAQEISRLLRFPFAINIESFAHGRVEMVEFKAEEGDGLILRLYEAFGKRTQAQIRTAVGGKVYLCDLMERELEQLPLEEGCIPVCLSGFEIVTLKITKE
jgi:trk system potassium uptake protein TrkA